jgi:prolipoprotein diacylglyceryltransferase
LDFIFVAFYLNFMKLNLYSILLILIFIITVSITNKTIKNQYEKTTNDSSFHPIDSIGFERKM